MHTYDMSANIKFEIADLSCIVYIQFVNISKCLSAVVSSVSSSQLISIPHFELGNSKKKFIDFEGLLDQFQHKKR